MTFTRQPQNFTPASEPVLFGMDAGSEPADVEVALFECPHSGEDVQIAALRLYGITKGEVDIAPYLHSFDSVVPLALPHTQIVEAATHTYRIEAGDISSDCFTVADNTLQPVLPSWLSSMGRSRRIGYGESDEVRLYGEAGTLYSVRISSDAGDEMILTHTSLSGAAILHIATSDFAADARTLEVSLAADGVEMLDISYTLLPRYGEQVRLAWRSSAGTIERYTFPVVREVEQNTVRTRTIRADGSKRTVSCSSERVIRLTSGYENRSTAEAVAEIAASPAVWICGSGSEPREVDVISSSTTLHSFGRPDRVEIDLRSHGEVALQ